LDSRSALIVTLSRAEYDIYSCEDFALELQETYDRQTVIVDMSAVTYLDSTCLGKLARMRSERAARGYAPAHLVVTAENIKRLFKIVHFDELWPLYDSLEEALEGSIPSGGALREPRQQAI
jgi:anti-anti-sigma factor